MLGRYAPRQAPTPIVPSKDSYAQRAADSLSVYNADMEPPATSYATSTSPLSAALARPTVGPKTNAAYVSRKPRMNGLRFFWSWGAVDMLRNTASLPGSGSGLVPSVRSTAFQPMLVQLHDWTRNANWYIAWNGTGSGMFQGSKKERYAYPSFRVSQVNTSLTGGPGPSTMRMNQRPRFTSVQAIKKYTAQPSYYNTKGSPS
jgi:hypothetical protein